MIQIDEQNRLFTLQTEHSTYQMKADAYGVLIHTYYGAKVAQGDLSYTVVGSDRGFSGNPNEVGDLRSYSLDVFPQEYSTFGTGDYRASALALRNTDGSLDCELRYRAHKSYAGKGPLPGLPAVYGAEQDVQTLEITLADVQSGVEVLLSYSVFEKQDVITRHAVIRNGGSGAVCLERALSCCVDFHRPANWDLISFYGRHCFERAVERTPIRHGKLVVDSVRGASSHHQNPFVILCDHQTTETTGDCFGFSFVYSGNFLVEAELDQAEQTRVTMGIHPDGFFWKLQAGESFIAPEVVLSYSGQGLGQLSRNYHRIYRDHLCRGKYQHTRRPVLINNWEATYFDFDSDKLVQIAEDASKLGIEMLVMDDGWFGKREGDVSGLGDWVVNEQKIKGGLEPLCQRINALGMKFGLWFEPEMVSEDSDLYRTNPEWCLRSPGRGGTRSRFQLVLDMSRQDVQDYLFDAMSKILKSANIEYIKWDMNRHLTNVWSAKLPADRQGEVYHRYVLGLYSLLERLTSTFPDVLFEGCSGGGGRFDAGMLYYSPQIWCSDDTDALERIFIQYGTSFGYPISAVGSHVSASPNHQTGRSTPLHTRGVVAMSGTFGYELDINKMTADEKQQVKEQVETFKCQYDLISEGDYYRLTNPYENTRFAAWEFVSADHSHVLLNFVQIKAMPNPSLICLKLEGLDEQAVYELDSREYTGAMLLHAGLPIPPQAGDCMALQFELHKK